MTQNPLINVDCVPRFADIEPKHIEPALDLVLANNREALRQLSTNSDKADWDNFAEPLVAISDKLDRLWSVVSHLNAVNDSEEFRSAYEVALQKWTIYQTEVSQNRELFSGFKRIENSPQFGNLNKEKQKVIQNAIRDFKLGGSELEGADRKRFATISAELAALSNNFEQNVLDATDGWYLDLSEESELDGLPFSSRELARQTAERAGVDGWRFTSQAPSFIPFMMFSAKRELRRTMYHAYVTRASECCPNGGKWDNSKVMDQIRALRQEQAALLGYESYASYALVTRMAKTPGTVEEFLVDLVSRSRSHAHNELQELINFVGKKAPGVELKAWDIPYWSEKLRQSRYEFSQEDVRPFFPLPRVLEGMFEIVHNLFGIAVRPASVMPQVWHPDVMFFEIFDDDTNLCGQFYLDVYARANKRGGAWMADCISRSRKSDGDIQIPVAMLTCNFSPPIGNKSSLLTHEEVLTLFHEFGHGLHHMLTKVSESPVAGINGVPWDAVELPSQFLENWCWQPDSLDMISGHFESGESLPADLLSKLRKAKNFQSGMQMIRQLEFSLFDLRLHSCISEDISIQQVLDEVRRDVSVVDTPPFNRFQHAFSHIFAGGYAAGYYSYKWAEVLSADAFGRFEEEGLFNREAGDAFRSEILEKGGVCDPSSMFLEFRGRAPSVDALIRHLGLS
ncbi:MAG: oligopeptidase A [Acidiferrobacteraceae bacterium]|nr:oligopeptidase A [Acidiferrobacteraceae bacterium]|tara:strand:- start:2448 stop:4487 length:2040 start_codon:yes stop_codon:yes gene_type:complete